MLKTVLSLLIAIAFLLPTAAHAHSGHDHDEPSAQQSSAQNKSETTDKGRRSPGKGKEPHAQPSAYKPVEILGWKLHVHEDLLAETDLYKEVYDEMHHQLFRITKVVPADKVALLQQVPVWVELQNPYSSTCQYHPSKAWLAGNGYLPQKAKGIEISSAKGFLRSSQGHQPFVMLHELAHAYHDLHLGFNRPDIIAAYQQAKEKGSYDEVLHINGRTVKAYAITDHKEYFAEATEAFFGTNDHYPFVNAELKQHDPQAYEALKEVWGVK